MVGESDNKQCLFPPSRLCHPQVGHLGHHGPQLGSLENPPPGGFALHDSLLWHLPGRSGGRDGNQRGDSQFPTHLDVDVQAGEDHGSDTLVVFQGLATGSLLYVVFFEIMEKERKRAVSGLLQVREVWIPCSSLTQLAACANCPLFCGTIAHT